MFVNKITQRTMLPQAVCVSSGETLRLIAHRVMRVNVVVCLRLLIPAPAELLLPWAFGNMEPGQLHQIKPD